MKEKIENLLKESFNNIQKNVRGITQKFSEIQKAIIRKNVGAISEENGKLINSDGEEFNPLTDSSQVTHNGDKVNEIIDTITDEVNTLTDRVNSNAEIISNLTGSGDGSVTKIVTDAINTLDSEVVSVNNPDIIVTVTGKDGKLSKVSVESSVPNNTAFNALKNKVEAFLEATEIQGDVIDTLSEIQNYIKGDLEGAAAMANSISKNAADIANEKERALSVESNLATSINDEITRATEKENEIASNLSDEITRATIKENELSNAITEESTRATEKENEIANALNQEIERSSQRDTYLETQKADKTGYFKDLKVGTADNLLIKNEEVDSEFVIRPVTTDNENLKVGTARINTIKGNSVVWNCEYKNDSVNTKVYFGDSFAYRRGFYISLSQNKGDKIYICQTLNNKVDLKANASFLTRTFGYNSANKVEIVLGGVSNTYVTNPSFFTKGVHTFATIHTVGDYAIDTIYCDLQQEDGITDYSEYSVKLVNLTKMFNGVNVPTTVEEFEALYGNMPDEYNEGTIIDNHTTAIKSVGVNAWDEEWELGVYKYWDKGQKHTDGYEEYIRSSNFIKVIPNNKYAINFSYGTDYNIGFYDAKDTYISLASVTNTKEFTTPSNCTKITFYTKRTTYNHDICIHLAHTGYLNGKYFPYESQTRELPTVEGGLKSTGSVYDEIRYNKSKDKWEHVQRVGSVDLGTLDFEMRENSVFVTRNIVDRLLTTKFNAISSKYKVENNTIDSVDYIIASNEDEFIQAYCHNINTSKSVFIKDSKYTDVTTFKAAMQGVILYYELATPIVTELDVDISPDYKVWDYGTEEAISEQLSTPLKSVISREFISNSQIVDNHIDIEIERERAINKDKELESNIIAESTRAQLAETNLNTELNKVKNELTVTNEAVVEEFTFEPHNQDSGVAQINSIHGNSVVWNQLAIQPEDNIGKVGETKNLVFNRQFLPKNNHVYLCTVYQKETLTSCERNTFSVTYNSDSGVKSKYENPSTNYKLNKGLRGWFFTLNDADNVGGYVGLWIHSPDKDVAYENFQLYDLTKMFGSGNEPTTVEEFESLYGNMPSEYNEGEIINNKVSSIKSVGTNIWDGQLELGMYDERGKIETGNYNRSKNPIRVVGGAKYYFSSQMNGVNFQAYYYDANMNYVGDAYWTRNYEYTIPTNAYYMGFYCGSFKVFIPEDNDICINLSDESINGKYFPYEDFVRELPTIDGGLKSAGGVYDEIRYNVSTDKWEHVQRVGNVDLGTLEWSKHATNAAGIRRFITKSVINAADGRNMFSINYRGGSTYYANDKTVESSSGQVHLCDHDYNEADAVTFKQAMQGVILYYKLAEPIVTELSDDYNLSYQISKCGTVEAISDGLSSPFKGEIEYSTTIANKINSNIRQIEYLDNKVNKISEEVNQINVTYDELVSLRDNSQLKPGCWYRITDYVTTTSQLNTKSAGHQFDVLVLATDVNVLSEEARAIQHGGEDIIMYGTNYTDVPEMSNVYQLLPTNKSFTASDGKTYWIYDCFAYGVKVNDVNLVTLNNPPQYGESVGATEDLSTVDFESMPLTIGDEITTNSDYFYNSNLNTWKLWYCLDNDTDRFDWATNGAGVIYRMIDEYGNDCPYDFKNILFNNFFTFGGNVDFTMLSVDRSILNTIKSSYINNKRVLPFITFEVTSKNTKIDNDVFYINVKGTGGSEVIGATILYGVSGTYDNILNIEIPNNNLPMKVAKNSNGEIKIYNEVDLIS